MCKTLNSYSVLFSDVDECDLMPNICNGGTCHNSEGGFRCEGESQSCFSACNMINQHAKVQLIDKQCYSHTAVYHSWTMITCGNTRMYTNYAFVIDHGSLH